MTFQSANAAPACLSRRSILRLFALSPLPVLASCATGLSPYADPADEQINRVIQAYTELARRKPDLPGVRSLARLNETLAKFSDADLSLLASALYLQAQQRVRAAKRPLAESDVPAVLSKPIDISRFSRRSLERTLKQAKARMAQDVRYRGQLDAVPIGSISLRCFLCNLIQLIAAVVFVIVVIAVVALCAGRPPC
jgi:hypothetical protein